MTKTGRNPYETTDVTPYHGDWTRRLRPPESLGARERAVFLDLVTSTDPRQFRASDLPLLCRYAELVVLAEQAAGELAACGVVIEGKPSPWFAVHASAVKSLSVMALRLRLSPQARAPKQPKTVVGTVSYYERMMLEGQHDEADEGRP